MLELSDLIKNVDLPTFLLVVGSYIAIDAIKQGISTMYKMIADHFSNKVRSKKTKTEKGKYIVNNIGTVNYIFVQNKQEGLSIEEALKIIEESERKKL